MSKGKWLVLLVVAGVAVTGALAHAATQNFMPEPDAFFAELHKFSPDPDRLTAVWWAPDAFWQVAMTEDPAMTEVMKECTRAFSPYTLVAVLDGEIDLLGEVTYVPKETIRETTRLKDRRGNIYTPIPDEKIGADVKIVLIMMRPGIEDVLGAFGENMHFLLFPAKTEAGEPICDPRKEGSFSVVVGTQEFKWRLPLASLFPPKICPVCGEELNSTFKFCPWDGTRLPDAK